MGELGFEEADGLFDRGVFQYDENAQIDEGADGDGTEDQDIGIQLSLQEEAEGEHGAEHQSPRQ